jgi:S-(hydroxymethyl)glutathione dehydrogenase / alcohol dehydrogenase
MKAAVLHKFNEDLVTEDVDIDSPRRDEVLVRTVACGVCHSDRGIHIGKKPSRFLPVVLGHEAAGVVEQVGSEVAYVQPGDHVVLCASAFCGVCRWCMRGQLQHCENKNHARADGTPRLTYRGGAKVDPFVGLGGFAERMLVHERAVVKLPKEMPLDRASLLGCAVITGLGAVRNGAKVRSGETVAVIGCGGVGLNVIQGARLVGASRIIAVDLLPAKLEMAKTFGATDVIDGSTTEPVEAVRELTGGGVDHAIEVVGAAASIEQAYGMLGIRGTATVVGVARAETEVKIKPATMMLQEKRLQGSVMGSSAFRIDIPLYAQLYMDGRLKLDELLSERISLDGVSVALAQLDKPLVARAVVTF